MELELGSLAKVEKRSLYGGIQFLVTFANGYQASVVNHNNSYGTELAVMHDGKIVYDTPVTSDVLGHLDREELVAALYAISYLPERV